MTELLLKHGAMVNATDLWKFTPLHEAAAKGKYDICKLLLKVSLSVLHCIKLDLFSLRVGEGGVYGGGYGGEGRMVRRKYGKHWGLV